MRTRQEIKAIGREQFQRYYWLCVGAVFIITAITGSVGYISSSSSRVNLNLSPSDYEEAYSYAYDALMAAPPVITAFCSVVSIAATIITGPLTIGLNYFCVQVILDRRPTIGTPFVTAFTNFWRKAGGYLWMVLFTFLWSLLLIIPGIIKGYSYAMTPYILADCPNVRATDAIKLSMRIMDGKKGDLFVFNLSYIGWHLLSVLTLGILGIFYVNPYQQSALACWYLEAREDALRNGVVTMAQLEGTEPV